MNRSLKKFLYGLFYFALFSFLFFGFFRVIMPSRIPGGGELPLDNGKGSVSKESPLRVQGSVKRFSGSSGITVLLGEVVNTDTDRDALFSYRFTVFGSDGALLETVEGSESAYASELRRIFGGPLRTPASSISRAELEIFDILWRARDVRVRPKVSVSRGPETGASSEGILVTGAFVNRSAFSVPRVKVIAVLFDSFLGIEIFAGQTVFTNVGAFEEKEFRIYIPADEELLQRINPDVTKVYIYTS